LSSVAESRLRERQEKRSETESGGRFVCGMKRPGPGRRVRRKQRVLTKEKGLRAKLTDRYIRGGEGGNQTPTRKGGTDGPIAIALKAIGEV